jgi:hypothetical protein
MKRPVSVSDYDFISITVYELEDHFEVELHDNERNATVENENEQRTIEDAQDYAKALALDYVHQHRGKPFDSEKYESVVLQWRNPKRSE